MNLKKKRQVGGGEEWKGGENPGTVSEPLPCHHWEKRQAGTGRYARKSKGRAAACQFEEKGRDLSSKRRSNLGEKRGCVRGTPHENRGDQHTPAEGKKKKKGQ